MISIYVPLATRGKMGNVRDRSCCSVWKRRAITRAMCCSLRREEIEFQDLFVISQWPDKVYYLCAPQRSAVVHDKHFCRRVQSRLLSRYVPHRIDLQFRELDFATGSASLIRENRTRE